MTTEVVEVRCPVGPQRLFAKFRLDGGVNPTITDDNLIEFACSDCRKTLQRSDLHITRVLHRYNIFGELVESDTEH
jgi:hypothetical protein